MGQAAVCELETILPEPEELETAREELKEGDEYEREITDCKENPIILNHFRQAIK